MDDLSKYPLRGLTDARTAIAAELATFVRGLKFSLPKTTEVYSFAKEAVHADWPTWNSRAMSSQALLPAAAVLPDRPTYEASCLTPAFLDETWSGGDPNVLNADGTQMYPIGDGSGVGFGLFKTGEISVPLVLLFRATTKPQRRSIMRTLEQAFVDSIGMDVSGVVPYGVAEAEISPPHYGIFLELKNYYRRRCRYTLMAQQLLDSEELAGANRWIGQIELTANTSVCVLRRVRAMTPSVRITVNDVVEDRTA